MSSDDCPPRVNQVDVVRSYIRFHKAKNRKLLEDQSELFKISCFENYFCNNTIVTHVV